MTGDEIFGTSDGAFDRDAYMAQVTQQQGLPEGFISSLVNRGEKSGSMAVSPKGALGIGQFMPKTWAQYGEGPFANATNDKLAIDAIGRYGADLNKRYGGDVNAMMAEYNGGIAAGNAIKQGMPPPAAETRAYLNRTSAGVAHPNSVSASDIFGQQSTNISALAKGINALPPATKAAVLKNEPIAVSTKIAEESEPKTSALSAFIHGAEEGVLPAAAGAAAFGAGATAGGAAAAPLAAISGPFAPIVEAVGVIGGGLAASMGAGYTVRTMQNYALSMVPESVRKQFGMDAPTRAKEEKEHPYASMASQWAASLPFFRPGQVSAKQAAQMFGLGAGLEAGREWYTGEPLDPIKIMISGGVQTASAKSTKLGEALQGAGERAAGAVLGRVPSAAPQPRQEPSLAPREPTKTAVAQAATSQVFGELNPKLSSIAPMRDYVGKVQDTLGPGWSQEAIRYYREMEQKFPGGAPLPTKAPVQQYVNFLSDELYRLNQMRQVDKFSAKQWIQKMTPAEFQQASSEGMYHTMPDEVGAAQKRTPEMESIYQRFIKPLQQQQQSLYHAIAQMDGVEVAEGMDHNPRSLNDKWLTKVARQAEDVFGSSGFGRKADNARERTMLAIEDAQGTRQVVRRNGLVFEQFNPANGKWTSIARTNTYTPIGGSLVDDAGRNVKLTQASTAEIEAQTPLRYNKNALANLLQANAEMRSYLRERSMLDGTMDMLTKAGAAIPISKVKTAPNGFRRVQGHPKLEAYYINERFAEPFEDALGSHGGGGMLGRINNFAVGSMFWNPEPHLFNAFDHFYTTIGWDLLKPWQYRSLWQDAVQSYRDVSTLSPDYQKFVNSGMGLQYARIAGEETMKTIMKGIGKRSWDQIAVDWSMHPQKMISALYTKSRQVLWGGSDVMMLTAYRHLASEKGVNILNKALQNYVEAYNPNYRIPSRVGFDAMMKIPGMPEVVAKAISRTASVAGQSRLFNMFGRYHFGQFRALGQNMHDLAVQSSSSVQTRGEALEHLAFTAFNLAVVYPFVWDQIAKVTSGDPNAHMRRSGSATIPYTLYHILLGDQNFLKLLAEAYNLPPLTKGIIELTSNRNLFTGQHIWESGDTMEGNLDDLRSYASGLMVSPMRTYQDLTSEDKDTQAVIAGMFGVKTKPDTLSDDQLEKQHKAGLRHAHKKGRRQDELE